MRTFSYSYAIIFISFFIDVIKTSSMLCFKKTVQTVSFLNIKNSCIKCKWFIPNPNTNPNSEKNGFCRKFKKFNYYNNDLNMANNIYEYAIDCRKNGFQCGKNAYYFEPKEEENEEQYLNNDEFDDDEDSEEDSKNIDELLTLQNQIKEMEELNCGEVNEKRDLDDWETEYISIKKRIEKLLNSRIKE